MIDLKAVCNELMSSADQGALSVSLIAELGGQAQTFTCGTSEPEPQFLAYSITKSLIAVLILQLVERGELGLDDDIRVWQPKIAQVEQITLRRLLNHSAGIPDYGGLKAYHEAVRNTPSRPWSFEQIAAATFAKGLAYDPGQGWAYANPGYMLLKQILERVTGMSLKELVAQRIAQPLALEQTFVVETIDDLAGLTPALSRYLEPKGELRDLRGCYHPGWVSHGVVASTPSDMARLLDRLMAGELLSNSSLEQMLEPIAVPNMPPSDTWGKPSYGLGLMIDPQSRWGRIMGHNGGGPGYNASLFHARDLGDVTICVMSAREEGVSAEQLVFQLFDRIVK
jgi:D-alanyl-D-alanine carboxypeptidase